MNNVRIENDRDYFEGFCYDEPICGYRYDEVPVQSGPREPEYELEEPDQEPLQVNNNSETDNKDAGG